MKHVTSVSLGSSDRNKAVQVQIGGQDFQVERIGTDGDMVKFADLIRQLDGKADAIGFGGGDVYVYSGKRRYAFKETYALAQIAKRTPVVDGSSLKNTLERATIEYLAREGVIDFKKAKVLLVCGIDRYGMAAALAASGCKLILGDLMFALGIPIPIWSSWMHRLVAFILMPVVVRLPFKWLYPTGDKQRKITPKYGRYFRWADVIAGDFLLIRKHLPEDLSGKVVITNTTTEQDVALLKERGLKLLVTSTPVFEGRSFGTNVMEGVILTLLAKPPDQLTPDDYFAKAKELGWKPELRWLGQPGSKE
jgi:hypothetical protein